jgi:S-adenosylmethionine:tRNA ribosyltransferase-isomerase
MDVAAFDFDLPRARIAQRPARPRDAARLLEVRPAAIADRHVSDLPACLRAGDLLVFNDTKVLPARLSGTRRAQRGTSTVEITLNRPLGEMRWSALARPAKRLQESDIIDFDGLEARVVERRDGGEVVLAFATDEAALFAALETCGAMPLPPYLGRAADAADRDDYQTMFARVRGAYAAPTAALHFTPRLMQALAAAGIERTFVTLHVGAGTFLPVTASDTVQHRMHPEWGEVPQACVDAVRAARARGGRVVAVGTTALRLLETAAIGDRAVGSFRGDTALFVTPGYRFRAVDLLLTNFHLPRSTLFMLVCAFAGTARMQAAYAHAMSAGYRFYSYGDATLLHPQFALPAQGEG